MVVYGASTVKSKREAKERSRSTASSPSTCAGARLEQGTSRTVAILPDVRRTERQKTRPTTRFRVPRLDSAGEEVEGNAADLLPRFDLLGVVSSSGDARGMAAGRRHPWELGLGFRFRGKMGRNE